MADILQAKRELYNELKIHAGVTGAGIQEKKGQEVIVVFLSDSQGSLKSLVPSEYQGYPVRTEYRSVAKAR